MKKIIIAALVTVSSFALNTYVKESANTVLFPGSIMPITKTCLNEDGDLQTLSAIQLYETRYIGRNREVKVPTVKKFLTTPVDYVETVCVQYGNNNGPHCRKFEKVAKSYPLISTVKYYEVKERKNSTSEKLIKTVTFQVPECK